MKKLYYLIILTVILGLVLTGCFLSNVGQVPATEQSGVAYLTKGPPVPSNLVALWHFDDDALDSSGTIPPNDGTVSGDATYAVGRFDNSLSLDGTGDYVSVADSTSLDITTELTIEAWVHPDVTINGSTRMQIIDKGEHEFSSGYMLMIFDGDLYGRVNKNNDTACIDAYPNDGEWHHVAYTFKSGEQKLYIDGSVVATNTGSTTITTNSQNLLIGRGVNRPEYCWDGAIDEVRIWDIALPSEDIFNLPGISVEKTCPISAYVGGIITYNYTVTNTGDCTLYDVFLVDDVIGPIELDGLGGSDDLAVGEEATGTVKYDVPSDVVSPLMNIAIATGTSPFGVTVTGDDSCSVVIYHEETAWAYGVNVASPNNEVPDNSSNAWGWTNYFTTGEGTYFLDLYAAAGQNILSNGFLVGTVTVEVVGDCVTVTYDITEEDEEYMITEAHLWVGDERLPKVKQGKKWVPTSAPGQFPFSPEIAPDGKSATIEVCEVDVVGLDLDDFWVAAHAVIEWEE